MTDATFGLQLFEELKRQGGLEIVTARLDYAQIQQLKAAERGDLLRLFHGSDYAILQLVKRDTPEQLARAIVRQHDSQRLSPTALILFGIMIG